MAGPKNKQEGKRRLFHSITSRIPHYIPAIQSKINTDSLNNGDSDSNSMKSNMSINTQGKSPAVKNIDSESNINLDTCGKDINLHLNLGALQQNVDKQANDSFAEDNTSTLYRDMSNPVTQGTDSANFSYIESVRKAPTKRYYSNVSGSNAITPTYPFRNSASGLLNPAPSSVSKFGFSPAESSANSDVSFAGKTDSIIINESFKGDINEYDYKTFGTQHPLRLSKVKAFEQSELTTKTFFSVAESNIRSANYTKNELVLQIPGLSIDETKKLLSHDTVESRTGEKHMSRRRNHITETNKIPLSNVDRRIHLMKNVLAPMSTEDLMSRKLEESGLSKTFQQNGEFLQHLDLEEIDCWSSMNEEFESNLREQRKDYYSFVRENKSLIDNETLHAIKSAMKHRNKEQFRKRKLEQTLSAFICKRIKDDMKDKTFLN